MEKRAPEVKSCGDNVCGKGEVSLVDPLVNSSDDGPSTAAMSPAACASPTTTLAQLSYAQCWSRHDARIGLRERKSADIG